MQLVADKWKALPEEEKVYYHNKSDIDKVRHQKETENWNDHIKEHPEASHWKSRLGIGPTKKQVIYTQPSQP